MADLNAETAAAPMLLLFDKNVIASLATTHQSKISLYALTRAESSHGSSVSSSVRKNSKNLVRKKITWSVPKSFSETIHEIG